jgi:hypothetical protein
MPVRREQVAAALKYLGDKADLRGRAERALSLDPQEQDLADLAVETGASFIPGVGQALAARDVERARRANDPAGMALAASGAIPGGRLAKLLKGFDPTRLELDVYHGTPHRFPATEANPLGEFDASKIGTGEGSQAFGRGIYLAQNPQIAEEYVAHPLKNVFLNKRGDFLRERVLRRQSDSQILQEYMSAYNENLEEAVKDLQSIKRLANESASLYKADLPDEMIDRMLDYDKPVNEQSPIVLDALKRAGINTQSSELAGLMAQGQELLLAKHGIPGIKYFDAASRGEGGAGTRNFVVFPGEEKKVRILERK